MVIGEFGIGVFFILGNLGCQNGVLAQVFAQNLKQRCMLGEAFHQDMLRTFQSLIGIDNSRIVARLGGKRCFQIFCRLGFRAKTWVIQQ